MDEDYLTPEDEAWLEEFKKEYLNYLKEEKEEEA